MKYSLIQMVQEILSSMDSDEVNSINDTTEAKQVAICVRAAYRDIVARANLPEQYQMFILQEALPVWGPTALMLQEDFSGVQWIRYNAEVVEDDTVSSNLVDNYKVLHYLSPADFVQKQSLLGEDQENVGYTLRAGIKYFYRNDVHPSCYTSFDDRIIFFDSYNSDVESSVRPSRTMAYGKKSTPFNMVDAFVPPLDDEQFSLLLNEAKTLAWFELKQAPHAKAEQNSKRGWTRLQRTKDSLNIEPYVNTTPNYGRK